MIKNINLGIKISTGNFNLIPEIYKNQNIIDFIEIILMPEFTYKDINKIKDLRIPYVIHVPNSNYGLDFGDINSNINNLKYIKKINQYKDDLLPLCFVVHPESGDINLSIENLKKLEVKPISIENMPYKSLNGGVLLGYDIQSLKKYFEEIDDLELCLDFGHAIKAALSKNISHDTFIKKFLEFRNPILFHLSGGTLQTEIDEHLPLNKGDYNLREIKEILFNYGEIVHLTFEIPRNYKKGIKDDIKNMYLFIRC